MPSRILHLLLVLTIACFTQTVTVAAQSGGPMSCCSIASNTDPASCPDCEGEKQMPQKNSPQGTRDSQGNCCALCVSAVFLSVNPAFACSIFSSERAVAFIAGYATRSNQPLLPPPKLA